MNKLGGVAPTKGAVTYLTAVLEYMAAEVIEIAGNKRSVITPQDILLELSNDEELKQLFLGYSAKSNRLSQGVVVNGGFVTRPHPLLEMIAAGAVSVMRSCLAECPHLLAESESVPGFRVPVTPLEFACVGGYYNSAVALVECAADMSAFGSVSGWVDGWMGGWVSEQVSDD